MPLFYSIGLEFMNNCKMEETMKSMSIFRDEFLDSEENQKKYGFTTEVVDGIRRIYCNGDIDALNDAMYGPSIEVKETPIDASKTFRLSSLDNKLYATLPNTQDKIPITIKVGTEDSEIAHFSIVTETGLTLTQLCLADPAYYPDEKNCQYLIDMTGLSVLNEYVRNNFSIMIEEWNNMHPQHTLEKSIPMPNYRFLASYAYSEFKRNNS